MNLKAIWQAYRDSWVMQHTPEGFVTDAGKGPNAIALALLLELIGLLYWLFS